MAEQIMQGNASEMAAKQTIPTGYKLTEVEVIACQGWICGAIPYLSAIIPTGADACDSRSREENLNLSQTNAANSQMQLQN